MEEGSNGGLEEQKRQDTQKTNRQAVTCMNLEPIILGERNQTQNTTYRLI